MSQAQYFAVFGNLPELPKAQDSDNFGNLPELPAFGAFDNSGISGKSAGTTENAESTGFQSFR